MQTMKPTGYGAYITWFLARCREAARGEGGGYLEAARALASGLASEPPFDVEDEEWGRRLRLLQTLILDGDDAGVLRWFDRNLPRCLALIPKDRRGQFLRGIYLAVHEDGIDVSAT
jgi:hypothetical protein